MNVSSIGGNQNTGTDPTGFQSRFAQALGPVASLLGESSDQLMQELQSGHTSLSALAQQKGISQTDLVNAIKQGLQSTSASNGAPALSDVQLTNIANRIANHRHGGGHHHHGGSGVDPTSGASTDSSSITSTIQTDVEKLIADLQQSPAANPTNTSTTDNGTSTSESELLAELNRFDQSL